MESYTLDSVTMGVIKTCLVIILSSVLVLAMGILLFPSWLATGISVILPILLVGLAVISIAMKIRGHNL